MYNNSLLKQLTSYIRLQKCHALVHVQYVNRPFFDLVILHWFQIPGQLCVVYVIYALDMNQTLFQELYLPAGYISNQNLTHLLVEEELLRAMVIWSGGQDYGWSLQRVRSQGTGLVTTGIES